MRVLVIRISDGQMAVLQKGLPFLSSQDRISPFAVNHVRRGEGGRRESRDVGGFHG